MEVEDAPPPGSDSTRRFRDGSGWQDLAGYSRAVRRGNVIAVSGTTANSAGGADARPGDTAAQTRECLRAVMAAVVAVGGRPEDIVRTRVLLTPDADWEAASRVHGEVFATILPANSMYRVAGLLGDGFLVEVEADAVVEEPASAQPAAVDPAHAERPPS